MLKKILLTTLFVVAIVIIYFQVYFHYWFIKLLGGYVVDTLVPIAALLAIFLIVQILPFLLRAKPIRISRSLGYLMAVLALYLYFATNSVIFNEEGDNIRRHLTYIFSPPAIFISLLGIIQSKGILQAEAIGRILFFVAIAFSLYVAWIYTDSELTSLKEMTEIEMDRFTIAGDYGGDFGFDAIDLYVKRFAIPGLSSTTYGPMLVPLMLLGFYFTRYAQGVMKCFYIVGLIFLCYCLLMTVSRGPILAMAAGIIYLASRRWFSLKEGVVLGIGSLIALVTFARTALLRIFTTIGTFLPLDDLIPLLKWYGLDGSSRDVLGDDPRFNMAKITITFILQHPFLGMGLSRLKEVGESFYGKEHNNYLSVGASFGLITLLFYMLFVFSIFLLLHRATKRTFADPRISHYGMTLAASTLSLLVYLNAAPAEFHFIWVWFGLVLAWLANLRNPSLDSGHLASYHGN